MKNNVLESDDSPRGGRTCAGRGADAGLPADAQAQDYPTRPIRFILPVPPGGSVDTMARIMAEKLRQKLGQPVIVENRPGAGNLIGIDAVLQPRPTATRSCSGRARRSSSPSSSIRTARSTTKPSSRCR